MKNYILLFALALGATTMQGRILNPEEALSRLQDPTETGRRSVGVPRFDSEMIPGGLKLAYTYHLTDRAPSLYVFNGSEKGFVILPADDRAAAVAGYSETGTFDPENMAPQLSWWLEEYGRQIEYLRNEGFEIKSREQEAIYDDWKPIAPMVTTTWDQTSPYNSMCPEINNRKCVTGCVATAMAQVMNYWKYPKVGTGSIDYYLEGIGNLSLDLSKQPFEWDKMLDKYTRVSPQENIDAVAYLMKACGYSIKMEYSLWQSGAQTNQVSNALKNYFGYDRGVSEKSKSNYNSETWMKLIYDELTTYGPVVYSGLSASGGAHAFVCDGYDKGGYFHINWGWNGLSDGYFLLDLLDPAEQGTGGSSGGYQFTQKIISGIQPPVGRLSLVDLKIANAADDSGNVSGKGYIYKINDYHDIFITMRVRVTGGYVVSPLIIKIDETDPTTLAQGATVYENTIERGLNVGEGGISEVTAHVDFSKADLSKLYTMTIAYMLNNKVTSIGTLRFSTSSGVETIDDDGVLQLYADRDEIVATSADGVMNIEVYDLNGIRVASREGRSEKLTVELKGLTGGCYIVTATDGKGRTKRIKVNR